MKKASSYKSSGRDSNKGDSSLKDHSTRMDQLQVYSDCFFKETVTSSLGSTGCGSQRKRFNFCSLLTICLRTLLSLEVALDLRRSAKQLSFFAPSVIFVSSLPCTNIIQDCTEKSNSIQIPKIIIQSNTPI